MQRHLLMLTALAIGFAGSAFAADLPTDKPPEEKPKSRCYASLMDWLNTSAKDCPLTYGGITLYGTIDVGVGYNTAGIPFGAYYAQGVFYGIQRASQDGRWNWAQNGQSQSVLGVKMEEPLGGDWLLIGAAEFGFNIARTSKSRSQKCKDAKERQQSHSGIGLRALLTGGDA
jgi:opacity protein-like surface antigen